MAAKLILSRPGVVVALVLNPNSRTEVVLDGLHGTAMAVAWQQIFMYLVGHSLTKCIGIGCYIERRKLQISLARVRSVQMALYRHTSAGTAGDAPTISSFRAQKAPSIGLKGSTWAMICSGVAGAASAVALALGSSKSASSLFLSRRSSRAAAAFVYLSLKLWPPIRILLWRGRGLHQSDLLT